MDMGGIGLDNSAYVQKRLVLGKQQAAIRQHVSANKLQRLYHREKAYGVSAQPRALVKSPL